MSTNLVKLFQGNNDFCDVESYLILGEVLVFKQMREELTALNKVHDEVELFGSLKCIVKCRKKRTVDDFLEDLQKKLLGRA